MITNIRKKGDEGQKNGEGMCIAQVAQTSWRKAHPENNRNNDSAKFCTGHWARLQGKYVVGEKDIATDLRAHRENFTHLQKGTGILRIVFHGLRHTFATRCIESQCNYKTVSAILGQTNIATTLNLYVHPDMEQRRNALT